MADIRLVKPQANAVHNVPCATGNRFVLDFPSDAALFAKDGDDLVLSFEDGSSIRLQDFYTTYSKEEMPSFEMEGAEISGEDFFAALGNPDLMPAAGPSAAAATRGGGFNQYGNVELLQGIDRLGGLDISFNWGQEHEDDLYAYGHRDIDYGVSVVPVVPGILDPDIPVVDDPDNPNDGGTGPVVDKLEVWEEGLANGSNPQGENVPTMAHGGMNISAPDGVATIVIGTVTVYANGHLVLGSDGAPVKVDTGEGYLQVTGFNPATGRLEYRYTLTDSTQEHDQGKANEHFTHLLPVTVTDTDGDRGSSTIAVVIRDDEPDANDDANTMEEGANETYQCSGNVITGLCDGEEIAGSADIQGADGASLTAVVSVNTPDASAENVDGALKIRGEYGTLTIWPGGAYTYVVDRENYNKAIMGLKDGESLKDVFSYTLTDRDGDPADAYLTISINGTSHDNIPEFSGKVTVDEADLTADSNNGHVGNDPGIEGIGTVTPGSFTLEVMDGLVSMTIDGKPVGLTLNDDGTVTLTNTNPPQEFSDENGYLTIDSIVGVGKYTVNYTYHLTTSTQEHAEGADRNHLAENNFHSFKVTVSDQDGSSKCGLINVDIIDDIPELDGEPVFTGSKAQVSEEELRDSGTDHVSAPVDLAAAFDNVKEQYGADGPNQADEVRENQGVYTLELSANRVATNLEGLVGDGNGSYTYEKIFLMKTDGVVQGVAGDNNTPCFTISLDKEGNATFKLQQPVRHGEGTPTDNILTLETVDGGSFTIKYTITDADGDTASKSLDLGKEGVFTIKDSETGVLADKDRNLFLTVDESFANRNEDRFADGVQRDPGDIGKTAKLDAEYVQGLFEIQTGADDTGLTGMEVAHKFSLIIADNSDSGLTGLYKGENGVTQSGPIFLYKNEEDGFIYGRVGDKDGPEAFKLEIDDQTGEITLTMTGPASIGHDNKDKFDETATLADKIQVELTVTDRDGDSNSATANVTLNFQDDGPALSMPSAEEMTSKAQVADNGTITGHLSGEMQFDFGADGPAQSGAVIVEIRYGEGDPITITCTYNAETGSWIGKTEDDHVFTIKHKDEPSRDDLYIFEYTRPVSVSETSDGDVTIKVTVTDGDGDSIFQQTTDYAPTITVEDNDDKAAVKEAGVAGHERVLEEPNNPNANVSGKPSVSGKITLAQSSDDDKADDDNLSLILYGGSIKHTTLTLDKPNDDADATKKPTFSGVSNFGKIDEEKGGSFYLVQDGKDLALKDSVSEGEDYYGTLTFTKQGESDTWTWQFTLNDNETSKLVNSMTEKEEIHLSLKLGVSDGMLQDDSGELNITIHGTNDLPYFSVGKDWAGKAGDVVLTDTDGAAPQDDWETEWSGTLQAIDPDKDNGEGSKDQVVNHLKFSLTSTFSSDAGQVIEDVPDPYHPYSDGNDKKDNLLSSIQKDLTSGTDEENNLAYTEIETTYGTFRVYENGEYTYTPSDTSKIGADEYVTETFTVRVEDAHGSFATKTITITLRNENNATTGEKKVTFVVKEEGVQGNSVESNTADDYNKHIPTENGEPEGSSVLFSDVDVNDTLTLKAERSTLSWKEGETQKNITFPDDGIIVSIAGGASTSLSLVAILGEDGNWSFDWQTEPAQDADVVGTLTLTRTSNGDVTSSFELDPKNEIPFNENSNNDFDNSAFLDQLSQGETVTVKLPLTATSSEDGEEVSSTLTITIEGTNDRPVIDSIKVNVPGGGEENISQENSALGVEAADKIDSDTGTEAKPDLSGTILASDVDNDNGSGSNNIEDHGLIFTLSDMHSEEGSTISQKESVFFLPNGQESNPPVGNFDGQYSTIKTTYGELELDPDTGNFTYTMDEPKLVEGEPNAIMALGAGQSVTETYTVRVTDSHGSWTEKTFEITITGTNDRPEITSTTQLEVHGTEDKAVDEDYHPEQGDLSIELVDAREYDNNDSIEGYYFVDTQDGEQVSKAKESVAITVDQLRNYLKEPSDGLSASDSSKVELLARLDALEDTAIIATLKVETVDGKGKLTLEPNQDSSFIQALNANDKLTLELSELCGMYVSAKDTHNAYADGVDVTLVLHGKNDAQTSISADAPTVKEEGVYCVGDNGNIPTQIHEGTDSEIGYTQHRTSSKGEFTISDRDAGQITFTYKNKFTGNTEVSFKEAGTTIGENAVSYEQESEGAETYYVFGTYGYYEISLTSSLDVDQGEKTFDYTYHLYSEDTPDTIQNYFSEDFDDRLAAVNSIPQSERVVDTVELTVETEGNSTSLTLNATVVGSNDVPVIENVAEVNEEDVITLDVPGEGAGPNTMELVEEGGKKTLQITLQSSETGAEQQFVGKIIGNDPDLKAEDYLNAQGTEIRNYSFVLNGKASNVWTISTNEGGEQQATSDFGYITIDAEGVFHIHLYKDAGKTLAEGAESVDIFAGLGVRCTDTLGATSEIVNLSGKLVGVDDIATVTPSHETIWEGVHAYDGEPKGEIPATSEDNWAENAGTVTDTISVYDPDNGDTISHEEIIVIIDGESQLIEFNENGHATAPAEYGEFTFYWTEDGKLEYTYKIEDDEDVKNEIQKLNLDEFIKDEISIQFHSNHGNNIDTTLSNKATISITIKGTNDAPVIDSVTTVDKTYNHDEVKDSIDGGAVGYRGSIGGTIVSSDVDNADGSNDTVSTLVYGILIYTDDEGKQHLVHAHTGEDGRTVYTAADDKYELPDDMGERLTFLPQATLEHGSIVVNENGEYTYYHESDSIEEETTESVWITVRDPHGAMDSVEISFTLIPPNGPGRLPEVTMEENVDLSVIEPSPSDSAGDHLVHVGSNGTASSLDLGNLGLSLSVRYYKDEEGIIHLVAGSNEEGQLVDTDNNVIQDVEGLYTATGTLVKQENDTYVWEYTDEKGNVIHGFPQVELDIRLSDPDNSDSSWGDASYSLSTDYGTVYVTDSGELRFELDNRADALNAGEVINETVTIWINGKPQEHTLNLEVTGTADASEVEAPALTVDMDLDEGKASAKLDIDDIDNSDKEGSQDKHNLFIGTVEDQDPIAIELGKPIYVMASGKDLIYSYTEPTEEYADSWYGTLTFSNDDKGGYTYTFEAADSDINKKLADGHKTDLSIPIYVEDVPPSESYGDDGFDKKYSETTKTQTNIDITIIGKADTPEAQSDTVTITEDGTIPDGISEDEQGESAGPNTHAVKGDLQVVDYDGLGIQISGMRGDTSEGGFIGEGRVVPGDFGTLVLNSDGTYTYTVNYDSLQHLPQGENRKDTFTVELKTANSEPTYVTITVNVQGVNDLPTVSVTPVLSVLEQHGQTVTATGKVEAQDIDEGDVLTYGIETEEGGFIDTAYVVGTWVTNEEGEEELKLSLTTEDPQEGNLVGTITIDTDGEYTFKLEKDSDVVRQLEAGESASIVVDMGAKDKEGEPVTKPVTITIHGSNENPTVSTALQVDEDRMVVDIYTLTVPVGQDGYTATDAEKGDMTFTFERGGEYMKEVTTKISVDGLEYEISLTMGDDGTITIQYPDTLKKYINGLGADEKLLIINPEQMDPKLNVVVEDDAGGKTSSPLALTINGQNDEIKDLETDDVTGTSGTLTFTDVDRTDEHTITFNDLYANGDALLSVSTNELPEKPLDVFDVHGTRLGTLTFTWKEDGASKELSYTFEPDDAYLNTLPVGESKDISFSVTVNDGNGSSSTTESLSFKVTNKNDAPEISQSDVNTGTVIFSDDDLQDTRHTVLFSNLKKNQEGEDISFTLDSTTTGQQSQSSTVYLGDVQVGTLTITYTPGENNQDNKITYSFTAEEDLNDLDVGEHELEFSVSIKDTYGGESSPLFDSFTVTNTNDAPVLFIAEIDTNTGTFTITDEDKKDTHEISISYDGEEYPVSQNDSIEVPDLGSFFFTKDSSGTWTYTFTADPELQASIATGKNRTFSIGLNVSDGHAEGDVSKEISVTVEGANQPPDMLEPVDVVLTSLDELHYILNLPLTDTDEDSLVYTFGEGTYGTIVSGDSGQYFYQVNEDALPADMGDTVQDELHYTIFDGVNTVEGTLTVNLDVSALHLPEEPETPTEKGETVIPDGDTDDTQSEIPGQPEEPEETSDTDEGFEAMVYAIENGEDDTLLFARDTYSLADGEEMYSLSPDDPEENTVDIVAYDSTDYMVDGGEGVSFMVSDNEDLTMDDILQGDGQHGPIVSNIDVLITGHGAESLTNMDQLARDCGISVDRDANALTLDESWQKVDSGHTDTQVFSNGSLTLETSLDVSLPSDDLNVQAAMHQVTNN